jgi:hypothetical protein
MMWEHNVGTDWFARYWCGGVPARVLSSPDPPGNIEEYWSNIRKEGSAPKTVTLINGRYLLLVDQ